MYHTFDSVREFHVEISSRCNAACPMCSRNELGGATKTDLIQADWERDLIATVFDLRFKTVISLEL